MGGHLPNLLIVGVPKAGTGSLFSYLAQHPDICPATKKEIGYFRTLITEDTLADLKSYEDYFIHCEGKRYLLEATPSYCYGGERMLRAIKEILGHPKIIIILRDPVDRLWSAYTFQRSLGNLPGVGSFEDYISLCEEQRRQGHDFIVEGHLNGLSIGFYDNYLAGWFDEFSHAVKIIFLEHLRSDPQDVVVNLCRWLSIDEEAAASFDYSRHNETVNPRSLALTRAVFAVKRNGGGFLARSPALRAALRKAYFRLNKGRFTEELEPQTKQRVEQLYRDSNRGVAATLGARGYDHLPTWLSDL